MVGESPSLTESSGKVITAKCLEDIITFAYKKKPGVTSLKGHINNEWERTQLKVLSNQVPENQVYHLFVIYPFRAFGSQEYRRAELQKHQQHLSKYLSEHGIRYTFVVVEQMNNDVPFNKGLLINVGFKEIYNLWKKGKQTTNYIPYFCIHNSDLFPKKGVDYTFAQGFRDSFGGTSLGIGGIVVFDYLSYLRINGHPNDFFGWGGEDICVKNRISRANIALDRSNYNNKECVEEIDHYRDSSHNNENLFKLRNDNSKTNGVLQSKYTILDKTTEGDTIRMKVQF